MFRKLFALLAVCLSTGCAAMSNLTHDTSASRRNTCQDYVDKSAKFIGQQQGWGIAFAALAGTSAVAGAAVSNSDSGGVWKESKKTIFLTMAVPTGILAYNFLSNASSASTSVSAASLALTEKDDDVMWAGCERARATYWDGRTAGIAAAAGGLPKSQAATTPQGQEDAGNLLAAEGAAKKAAGALASATKAIADAQANKDPSTVRDRTSFDNASGLLVSVKDASDAATAAVAALKEAIASGDKTAIRNKKDEAEKAGDKAVATWEQLAAEIKLYLR